jgi:hypothetical protein
VFKRPFQIDGARSSRKTTDGVRQVVGQDAAQERHSFHLTSTLELRGGLVSFEKRLLDDVGWIKLSAQPRIHL